VKNIIFWGVVPRSLVEIYRNFGGTVCLHIHHREVSQASIQQYLIFFGLLTACFLLDVFFDPDDGGSTFIRNADKLLPDYTASHPRRSYYLNSVKLPQHKPT
jgi:hypothetical protein